MPSALRRVAIAGLVAFAALAPPQTALAQAAEMAPEDRALLRSEVRRYLLDHPEVIMEAVQVLEARRLAAEANSERDMVARNAEALHDDGFSFVAGNPDGDVTVVEFLDYACSYCKKAHDEVRRLVETDPGVRYVVKEFPILGDASRTAAQAALAAAEMDGGRLYMAFNDALMTHRGRLTEAAVYDIAEEVGLDPDALRAAAAAPEIAARLERTHGLARDLKIEGTPSFVIGGALVRGYVPLDRMREAVAAARAERG